MTRNWTYNGFIIKANPKGVIFKYVVHVTPRRILAGRTLAEVMEALDTLAGKVD